MKTSELIYSAPSCSIDQLTSCHLVCASDFRENNNVEVVDIADEYGW